RRRHTRWPRDWSSDVCSSDLSESIFQAIEGILTGPNAKLLLIGNPNNASGTFYEAFRSPLYQTFHIQATDVPESLLPTGWAVERSEERRVGKECRSRRRRG